VIDIGAELKALRISAKLTQEDVADLRSTTASRVSKIENNHLSIPAWEYLEWKEMLLKVEKVGAFTIVWPGRQMAKC
jgi:transcriptional regulator with XRE-family HTH domain